MTPHQMYSGQAPAAMGMMGQGLIESGANIARSITHGYDAMTAGLSKGMDAIGKQVDQYKQAKASNDMFKIMVDDPTYRDMLGIKSDEDADALKKNQKMMIDRHGQIGAADFSQKFVGPLQQYAMMGREYENKMKLALAQTEEDKRLREAQADEARARARALGQKQNLPPMPNYSQPFSTQAPQSADYTPGTPVLDNMWDKMYNNVLPGGVKKFLGMGQQQLPQQPQQADFSLFGGIGPR